MRFPLFHPPMITLKKNVKRLIWNLYARAVPHLHESPLFFTFLPIYFVFLSFFFPSFFLFFLNLFFVCACFSFFFFFLTQCNTARNYLALSYDSQMKNIVLSLFLFFSFFFYFFFLIFLARHEKSSTRILTRFSIVQISVSLFVYLFIYSSSSYFFFSLSLSYSSSY